MGARLAVAAALLLALSGCGTDDVPPDASAPVASSDTASASSSATASSAPPAPSTPTKPAVPAGAPRCKDVWVEGSTLPGAYKGCVRSGEYLRAEVLSCSSGQGIVRHDRRFWAVRGGTISQAADIIKDRTYLDSVARCRG